MATGIIPNPSAEHPITITLDSTKVGLANWGTVLINQVGNFVFIRFYGVTIKVTSSNSVQVATISANSKVTTVFPLFTTNNTLAGRIVNNVGDGKIYFAGISANQTVLGEMVLLV